MTHIKLAQVTLFLAALSLLSCMPSARCGQHISKAIPAEQSNDQASGENFGAPARQVPEGFKDVGVDVEQASLPTMIRDGAHPATSDAMSSSQYTPAASQAPPFPILAPFALSRNEEKPLRVHWSENSAEKRPASSTGCSICIQNPEDRMPRSSDATANERMCSFLTVDPVKFHCKYLGQRTKDAIIHLALAIVSLPLHTALGIAGGAASCAGCVGFCGCLRMPEIGCYHLYRAVTSPALGVVGGVGLAALSACVTVGDITAALYELSMIPIAACRRFVKGKATEKELDECKHRYKEWKELHDNSDFKAAHELLAGETLGLHMT